jgi:hypothetical protein
VTVAKIDKQEQEPPVASLRKPYPQPYWPAVLLLALAVGVAGCPALMLGSLGYEGYEYVKTGTLPGLPAQGTSKKPTPQASPAPDDIE